MKTLRVLLVISFMSVLMVACDSANDSSVDSAKRENPDQAAEATGAGARPSSDTQPCEVLSDELLARHFEIGDAEIKRTPSKYSPHPRCTASWPKPNAAELEAKAEDMRIENMKKRMSGEEVEPVESPNNKVSLTLSKNPFENRSDAVSEFDSALRILSEGMTIETERGTRKTSTYEYEPVDGVGEKAAWVPRMNQLSVATSSRIFHVSVDVSGGSDSDLVKAKELAHELAESL